jgi:hypothetical protein
MANNLTTTVSEQASTNTQNPQTVGTSSAVNGNTQNTQSSINGNSLNNSSNVVGIPLGSSVPNAIDLNSSTLTNSVATPISVKAHTVSPYAITFVSLIVLAAVILTVIIYRSSKITTEY